MSGAFFSFRHGTIGDLTKRDAPLRPRQLDKPPLPPPLPKVIQRAKTAADLKSWAMTWHIPMSLSEIIKYMRKTWTIPDIIGAGVPRVKRGKKGGWPTLFGNPDGRHRRTGKWRSG
jgi:hypothetical protein